MAAKIEKTTIIGDVLDIAPETAPLFMAIGMHCLGCAARRSRRPAWCTALMPTRSWRRSTALSRLPRKPRRPSNKPKGKGGLMAALLREAMKVPISNRLLLCAEFVPRGSRFGVSEKMRFFLSDGLQGIPPDAADTIIMAGMGGDLMVRILEAAPWVCDDRYTLILQPQSAGQALRQYLAEHSFAIEREALAKDGHFFYTVLRAKKGHMPPLSPGQQYASPQLLRADGPLLGPYLARIETALAGTVLGLQRADEPEKLRYYETALAEIREMRKQHDDCS